MINKNKPTTIIIALNKLDRDPKNVRKTYRKEGIEELAANLRSDGYQPLQNLVVREGDRKGHYFVTAGERRRLALLFLAEAGEIAADFAVECKERAAEDATAISLAENAMREEMNPVDQYEAFKAMADEGKDIADIAARFAISETIVRQRLALARVAPELLQLFRDEEIGYSQLKAFTICDDQKRQMEVWNALPDWNRDAHRIRYALTEEMIRADDKRFEFIGGVETYEAAGGAVKRDLFDTRDGGYATDAALLERLVAERFTVIAEQVKAGGWQWVECSTGVPDGLHRMERFYPEDVPLSAEDQVALDAAQAEYDEIAELIEHDAADDQAEEKLEGVQERIDALTAKTEAFSSEALEQAGAFVMMDYYGKVRIERGFVKAETATVDDETENSETEHSSELTAPSLPVMTHSAALIEDLTAHKTAALRIELANNADIGLVAVVHSMLIEVVYPYGGHSALQIRVSHERLDGSMKDAANCEGLLAFNDLSDRYGDILPGNPDDLFDWLREQPQDMLLSLLAFAAAHAVNAVEPKFCQRKGDVAQANQLARSLDVDMSDWFEPTADNYFNHVNRTTIELAVAEAKGKDAELSVRAAKKKAEAVLIAERLASGSGWLPVPVRIADEAAAETMDDETGEEAGSVDDEEEFSQAAE
ncbi:ParB/RepB/Spo0J family partition protein [Brucella anthropi]|uniref:ParB/RepB/Spo0J family partition protein n=2 Tax=Brucellaceae TaxID=118882 RepID=UPI002165E2F7|nr:ParB/RepB/Spo0J family partition protein [Brucella anthropi]UVV70806.1 ParB/RepB/Spo0J family partition protein [Brucella anthropi]